MIKTNLAGQSTSLPCAFIFPFPRKLFQGCAAPWQLHLNVAEVKLASPHKLSSLFLFNFYSLFSFSGNAEIAGVPFSQSVSATGLNSATLFVSLFLTGVVVRTTGDATLLCWLFLYLRVQTDVTMRAMKTKIPTQISTNVSMSRPKSTEESSSFSTSTCSVSTGSGASTGSGVTTVSVSSVFTPAGPK